MNGDHVFSLTKQGLSIVGYLSLEIGGGLSNEQTRDVFLGFVKKE